MLTLPTDIVSLASWWVVLYRSDRVLAGRIKAAMGPDELLWGCSTGVPPPKVIVVKAEHRQLTIREAFAMSATPRG
jgi:hypothetical protein